MRKRIVTICLAALTALTAVPAIPASAAGSLSSAVNWAIDTAADDTHGYSQSDRWGPNYDCSAFVLSALKAGGFNVNGATYSGDMKSKMTKSGVGFSWISRSTLELDDGTDNLKFGDVLFRSGHVELYIGDGKMCGAHNNYDGKSGDSSGREIDVRDFNEAGGRWTGVIRFTGGSKSAQAAKAATTTTTSSKGETYHFATGTYKVTAESLNVRSKADKTSSSLGSVLEGQTYKVTATNSKWGKISYKGKTGWISLLYCKKVNEVATASVTTTKKVTAAAKVTTKKTTSTSKYNFKPGTYKVNVDELTVREKASKSSNDIGIVKKGQTFKVTATYDKWGKITYKGKAAWISLRMCKKVENAGITVAATKITKTKKAKGAVTVTWKKVKGATGYEVYYSTSKNGEYNKLTAKSTAKKLKVSGLNRKTTYYFKVRVVKKVNNTNYYSAFSAVKSKKTK